MSEIRDDEIRIIGYSPETPPNGGPSRKRWIWIIVGVISILLLLLLCLFVKKDNPVIEPAKEPVTEVVPPSGFRGYLAGLDTLNGCYTVVKDTTIHGIPFRIYIPINAFPHMEVGYSCLDKKDNSILLFQAADVRADNKKIVGAFVLHGKILSCGLSKRGYCAILPDNVTVGVADNSPLFEAAVELGGDFFRQYPLVDNGMMVENELEYVSTRRALCSIGERIFVVQSRCALDLNSFSHCLVALGVENAIYLTGGESIGWCRTESGEEMEIGKCYARPYKNANFIVWQ